MVMQRRGEAMQKVLSLGVINWPPTTLETNLLGPLTRAPLRHVFIMTDTRERSSTVRVSSIQGTAMEVQHEAKPFNERCIYVYSCRLIKTSKFVHSICFIVSSGCVPAVKTFPTIFQPHPKIMRWDTHHLNRIAPGKLRPRLSSSGTVNQGERRCRFTGNNVTSEVIQGVRPDHGGWFMFCCSSKNDQSDWEAYQSPVFPRVLGWSGRRWWGFIQA